MDLLLLCSSSHARNIVFGKKQEVRSNRQSFSVGGYFYVGASPRSVHQRRDIVFIDKCYAAAACANHSQFHLTTREMRTWLDRLFVGGNKRDEREMDRRGRLFKETNDKIRHSDQVSARQRNRQCNCWQSDHELKERKTVK